MTIIEKLSPTMFHFIFLSERTGHVSYTDDFNKTFTVWFSCYNPFTDKHSSCRIGSVLNLEINLNTLYNHDNSSNHCR